MGLFGKKTETTDVLPPAVAGAPRPASPPQLPGHYGIEETIRLMRTLPIEQNLELVVRVVKGTLESMNVRLAAIIEDASRKQTAINERIAGLRGEISGLENEIAKRREEINSLERDLAETTKVKERLELAEAAGKPGVIPPPPGAPASHKPPPPPLRSLRQKPSVGGKAEAGAEDEERKTVELK